LLLRLRFDSIAQCEPDANLSVKFSNLFCHTSLVPVSVETLEVLADTRRDDAKALLDTGKGARFPASVYLGGYAVEFLLKMSISEARGDRYWTGGKIHRIKELRDKLIAVAPKRFKENRAFDVLTTYFDKNWTHQLRYKEKQYKDKHVEKFLNNVTELKKCLVGK
ncbi:MAG: hypothetical protein NUW37_07875, partial [Planctomycetes bacterium]|nr:hypothetical protein [Planctomycetota bacterium]